MHHLLKQMGREIVRQESPKEPGKRSLVWDHTDAFNVLRENTATSKIEGLKLDMFLFKEEAYASTIFGDIRKHRYEEFLGKSFLSNGSLKKHGSSIFSSHLEPTDQENVNQMGFEADAFARMNKLKLLQLNCVHISGSYKKFPKALRWLCWRGFPLKSIPSDFPLESLVALDLLYSCLKNVWEGTKLLPFLKILNLSHSYSLAKTPDFSGLPNLERLELKSCISLVEVHESIGSLARLVLLDLENCKSLRNLPGSIYMLKHLKTLVISGCSINLDGLSANIGNMESLTVLEANGIAFNQSPPTDWQLKTMHSFIWPWWLKPRESPKMSWPSLPRSLVKLSLERCGLSDDDFPRELSNLCSLKELNLNGNEFCSLPDFIRGLPNLDVLDITDCSRLRKLDVVPQIFVIYGGANRLLDEVTFQISHRPTTTCHLDTCNHLGSLTLFRIESIENVEVEIISNLGLSNLQSTGNLAVNLTSLFYESQRRLSVQVCFEAHIIYAYAPGSEVPPLFNFKNQGSSIDFIIPSEYPNMKIRGFNLCAIHDHAGYYPIVNESHETHIVISNKTKGLVWSHCPNFFGTADDADGTHTMWLSYWNFGNHLEVGEEFNVSVHGGQFVQVGVRLLCKDEQEEMTSHLQFGNIVPGNVSADEQRKILYQLGSDRFYTQCSRCEELYPNLYDDWINPNPDECRASRLLMPKPFHVSPDPEC